MDTEIKKLNTDAVTKQTVINVANSGRIVAIPADNVAMGDWHGTGYIVMNPDGYADDIIEQIIKYGDDAAKVIRTVATMRLEIFQQVMY